MTPTEIARLLLKRSKRKIPDGDLERFEKAVAYYPREWAIKQKAWHFLKGTTDQPKCKGCSATCKFQSSDYWKWCSNSCMGKDPDILAKKKATNKTRWGVESPQSLEEFKEKQRTTLLKKYGVENYSKSIDFRKKVEKTSINKYGVTNPSKSPEIKEKIKAATQARNWKSVVEKRKITNLEKYQSEHAQTRHISLDAITQLNDVEYLIARHFTQKQPCSEIAKDLGCSPTPILLRLSAAGVKPIRHSVSAVEQEIVDYLKTLTKNIKQNDRTVIAPKELDIVLPNHDTAIEVDGVYWHSERQGKDKNYHINKTNECSKKNLQLVHIYDTEWYTKQEIVKSKLSSLLGKQERIYARKCDVRLVSKKEKQVFLDKNHLQGSCGSSIDIGLYYQGDLVSIMTFGKPRFSKKYNWELVRYCSSLFTTVVGGASKLFKFFVRQYNPLSIVSYADRRWSKGNVYETLGFRYVDVTSPNYFYFKGFNDIILESRMKYQKHKLPQILGNTVDMGKTEWEIMQEHGYNRIWDCGNIVYIWETS